MERAFLIGNDSPETPGAVDDDRINYDPMNEVLAATGRVIPVCWLASFHLSHARAHFHQGVRIPCLLAPTRSAWSLFQDRRGLLDWLFPDASDALDGYAQLLNAVVARHLKVDCAAIWRLDPDSFEADLYAALSWFDTGDEADLRGLLRLSGINFDQKRHSAVIDRQGEAGVHLHGYRWIRKVPWQSD